MEVCAVCEVAYQKFMEYVVTLSNIHRLPDTQVYLCYAKVKNDTLLFSIPTI